jgi:two-component system NtrC family sensor kinase
VNLDEGVIGRVFRRGTAQVISDVSEDPDFVRWYPDTQAEIGVPIKISGETVGVLNVESDQVGSFGDQERLVMETVANQLAIAIENARLFGMVKEREDRYRVLVESNPGAVIHLDAQGAIIFTNPAAFDLTGRTKEQLLSTDTSLTHLAVEESRPELHEAIADSLGGKPRHDVEFEIAHADGRVRSAQASFQPLLDEQGVTQGVVVLAWDRTRERELQDRLYQSEKLGAIGGLVSGVAHELNNPLAGILGFAQLLLSRPTDEWTVKDVEKIEKNARRCQNIVENLLAFARQAKLSRRMANLNEIIDSVIRLNEYQLHMDDVEIQRDLDLRLPPLYLDVNRWQQVFVNLAQNAHQALLESAGGPRIIRFETRVREGKVVVRVSDTGPGIDPDSKARVFEPFFTTKDTGTGLGLGICYGIVTEHGGTIEVEPHADTGTCFRITLPFEASPNAPQQAKPEAGPARSDRGAGLRVLVVDDEENVRDVVARALQNHGYVVDTVRDGQTALHRIGEQTYDAILTDVSMPGEYKGFDLYDRVAEDSPALAGRIVFLTGHRHDDVMTAQIQSRGGRCIEKPFDIHALARVVNGVAAGEGNGDERDSAGGPSSDE